MIQVANISDNIKIIRCMVMVFINFLMVAINLDTFLMASSMAWEGTREKKIYKVYSLAYGKRENIIDGSIVKLLILYKMEI